MKSLFPIGVSACLALFGLGDIARASVFNGSFESWTLLGWQLEMPQGDSATAPFIRDAGRARTMSSWSDEHGVVTERIPQAGLRFAALSTRTAADFLGDNTYHLFINQNVQLNLGEALTGWSSFYNGDLATQDSAWVRIFDQAGNQLATPWHEGLGAAKLSTPLTATDWTQWHWNAPADGVYSVRLGMTTTGANNGASYGFFDGLRLQTANPVPEPSAVAVGALGVLLLALLRVRRK
jgi:hypothetical protein